MVGEGPPLVVFPGLSRESGASNVNAQSREVAQYRGLANPSLVIDDVTTTMTRLSLSVMRDLLAEERRRGMTDACRRDAAEWLARVSPDVVRLGDDVRSELTSCR